MSAHPSGRAGRMSKQSPQIINNSLFLRRNINLAHKSHLVGMPLAELIILKYLFDGIKMSEGVENLFKNKVCSIFNIFPVLPLKHLRINHLPIPGRPARKGGFNPEYIFGQENFLLLLP